MIDQQGDGNWFADKDGQMTFVTVFLSQPSSGTVPTRSLQNEEELHINGCLLSQRDHGHIQRALGPNQNNKIPCTDLESSF